MCTCRVRIATLTWVGCLLAGLANAAESRREIPFPDLPGYQTLVCDFHMHTVFSDGSVWPTVRVGEAWRQGLDAISIADHIEYQPHKDDVPTRHGRSYELAEGQARAQNVLFIRGAEITRDTPPGHFNAIFLDEVQPLDKEDFLQAIEQANLQKAFVFWNHQGWQGPEKGKWLDVHTEMFEKKWFQGMEVCNGDSYYPEAHKWCLEKNLTMLGGSDLHDPDLRTENKPDDHRTTTLVFAAERSLPAVQAALREGRTLVWYQDRLIGRETLLAPFFQQCVQVRPAHLRTEKEAFVEIRNVGNVDVQLERVAGGGPQRLTLPADRTSLVKIAAPAGQASIELQYTATNLLIAPEKGLTVTLRVPSP